MSWTSVLFFVSGTNVATSTRVLGRPGIVRQVSLACLLTPSGTPFFNRLSFNTGAQSDNFTGSGNVSGDTFAMMITGSNVAGGASEQVTDTIVVPAFVKFGSQTVFCFNLVNNSLSGSSNWGILHIEF